MIYITGDTHILCHYKRLTKFAKKHPNLTKKDYVIIAGDFGAIWSKDTLDENLNYYSKLPFSILFVDGNHENFDILNSYPVEIWNGGKVHKIRPDIIHLMRGQVFEIEGKTFFTFGGATSLDDYMREEGISWWKQEIPTDEELDEGLNNLKRYNNKVDYVITHSCSLRALQYPAVKKSSYLKGVCQESHFLTTLEDNMEFKHWYFGHFHIDAKLGTKYTAIMHKVLKIR